MKMSLTKYRNKHTGDEWYALFPLLTKEVDGVTFVQVRRNELSTEVFWMRKDALERISK